MTRWLPSWSARAAVGSAQRDQANAARAESAQERVEIDEIRDVIARRRDEASKERDQLGAKRDHDDELEELKRALQSFEEGQDSSESEPTE